MTFPSYMKDKNLFVPLTSWIELKKDADGEPFSDMIDAARKVIQVDGAFIVYRESDTAIMYRCDRMSELNELLA
jgi:hypothetical protein